MEDYFDPEAEDPWEADHADELELLQADEDDHDRGDSSPSIHIA
jgi:hypothetical protein